MENSHILIVDDNPEIREIIQILLSGEGFYTEEANQCSDSVSECQNKGQRQNTRICKRRR